LGVQLGVSGEQGAIFSWPRGFSYENHRSEKGVGLAMWITRVVRIGAAIVLFIAALSVPSHTASAAGRVALNTTASSSSVIGLWHLDETSGTTAFDSSGNGNDGAISGPVTLGVPGHLKTAYSFVPKSTVIVPNASDLVPGTAKITISYWLKTTTLPCCNAVDYDMFTKGDGSSKGGQIKIEVQGNGQASCMFRGASGKKQLQAGPNVVDGQWHQVTCVRDGTRIVETVDGASFSVTKATGAITVTDSIRLGSHKGGGDWYKGVLDEVTYSIG
jgi:Concanavalin A-like lectin/glucanases superfamily